MKMIKIFFLIIVFSTSLTAQSLKTFLVEKDNKKSSVSYVQRKGRVYASAKELSKALSGSFYYNDEAKKIELKFPNYKLKVTGKNQFIVLIERADNSSFVFHIPLSTIAANDDIYIPIDYTNKFLSLALQKQIEFDYSNNSMRVLNQTVNTFNYLRNKNENALIVKTPEDDDNDSDFDVHGINIVEKTNGTLIRLNADKIKIKPRSSIKNNTLYLFLSGVTVDPQLLKNVQTSGLVRKVKVKNVAGNYQIEFLLRDGFSTHETFIDEKNDIKISIHNKFLSSAAIEENKDKWKFDVVVIDPGHGGRDPGSIGVRKTREKDVNLGIALKLGKLIENNLKDVKVVYTRKTDKAVDLYKRGKIANENNGKLFISIHCNSLEKKPSSTKGFEVYLLRPGRTEEAISIAEYENSVIEFEENPDRYKELNDENFILVSMAHSAFMRYSEKFSDLLNKEILKRKNVRSRGIKQAGFLVLVGASMPGVLVESGFLSNRQEEAYLKSSIGQSAIAKAIYNAVKKYKVYYEKSFEEE